jgi:hypothetical protein
METAAPFLFSGMVESDDPRTGISTGERLRSAWPEVYNAVVALLGQGAGVREIKRRLGVHHRTIRAVAIHEGQTIDTMRKELGSHALSVAAIALESLEEKIMADKVKPGELSFAITTLIDKGQVLTGGVTGRVERIERTQVEREITDILAEVETIEDTGFCGGNVLPIGAGSGPADRPGAGCATGDGDSESTALSPYSSVWLDNATGTATALGAGELEDASSDQGAGGVSILQGGAENHTDK